MAYSSALFLMALITCRRGLSNSAIQRSSISWSGTGFR